MTTTPAEKTNLSWYKRHIDQVQGVAIGSMYGVLLRAYIFVADFLRARMMQHGQLNAAASARYHRFTQATSGASQVMTLAFLVLGPALIGFLTVRRAEAHEPITFWRRVFTPWMSVTCMMIAVAVLAMEGAICIVMALPLTLLFSSVGGIIAGLIPTRSRRRTLGTLSLAVLPFCLAPAETLLPAPTQTRTVSNQILIHANATTVWRNIERVPAISREELHPNWTHKIGFPMPIEATLSYEGVGGVRHASFERGILFIENVTAWEPERRLAFSIHANNGDIPATTLDEHVTVGGRYFDVLDGEYRLEPLPNGDTLLHLTSHQRLSTDFNDYAGLWTSAVMSNLQGSILQVIQHRCEHLAGSASTLP